MGWGARRGFSFGYPGIEPGSEYNIPGIVTPPGVGGGGSAGGAGFIPPVLTLRTLDIAARVFSTAGSGYAWRQGTDYPATRSGNGSYHSHSSLVVGQRYTDPWYWVFRGGLFYNTGLWLPGDADVQSATVKLCCRTNGSDTEFWARLVDGSGMAGTDIVEADYQTLFQETSWHGSWNSIYYDQDEYIEIEGTADLLPLISVTGWTKIGLRSSRDLSGIPPTGSEQVSFYTYDALKQPRLVVTYYSKSLG